ncbi:MAG: hypothetical protein CVV32_04955 [Methanomicrobiales archaeon HGW-Methanomicrobiales-3]|jgi:hypothetical protein|nr:MAG: hypothetical protein CVV32_04955 [Methanomicrobiales archaeon HGW-Methanomicrobiales-3]
MGSYKHIEHAVAGYLAGRYMRAVEAGIGRNTVAAEMLAEKGLLLRCTDIREQELPQQLLYARDDLFSPDLSLYTGADVIYSIRPAIEMVPPLVDIARAVNCDLVVYHLGFEQYDDGGEIIDCGVILHRYWKLSEPVKQG